MNITKKVLGCLLNDNRSISLIAIRKALVKQPGYWMEPITKLLARIYFNASPKGRLNEVDAFVLSCGIFQRNVLITWCAFHFLWQSSYFLSIRVFLNNLTLLSDSFASLLHLLHFTVFHFLGNWLSKIIRLLKGSSSSESCTWAQTSVKLQNSVKQWKIDFDNSPNRKQPEGSFYIIQIMKYP